MLFECARELLFNAVKHADISTADVTLLRVNDGRIRLAVRDEGVGFNPDLLRKRHADAVSFGLFSIQQRLAHLGGEMEIETAPGKGTSVALTIPVGEPKAPARQPGETLPAAQGTGMVKAREEGTAVRRVLIVDDHKIMREGLVGLMRFEPGIEVVGQAADGPQAIELAAQLQPDVIVMMSVSAR